jgi:hypothetical protein
LTVIIKFGGELVVRLGFKVAQLISSSLGVKHIWHITGLSVDLDFLDGLGFSYEIHWVDYLMGSLEFVVDSVICCSLVPDFEVVLVWAVAEEQVRLHAFFRFADVLFVVRKGFVILNC